METYVKQKSFYFLFKLQYFNFNVANIFIIEFISHQYWFLSALHFPSLPYLFLPLSHCFFDLLYSFLLILFPLSPPHPVFYISILKWFYSRNDTSLLYSQSPGDFLVYSNMPFSMNEASRMDAVLILSIMRQSG